MSPTRKKPRYPQRTWPPEVKLDSGKPGQYYTVSYVAEEATVYASSDAEALAAAVAHFRPAKTREHLVLVTVAAADDIPIQPSRRTAARRGEYGKRP